MNVRLNIQAFVKFICGVTLVGAMIFIPAGSWHFVEGWILMAALFVPMLIVGIVMAVRAPELLASRLNGKEQQLEQRWVVTLSGVLFTASFIIAGLNYRYGWHELPRPIVWLAVATLIASYALYAEVARENTYLSRTVEIQEGQQLIDTGLYGVVRHPMYTATLLMFLAMPLVLNSPISFLIMLLYIPIITIRIRHEEHLLENKLHGYLEYKQRVKYRIIPYIW